MYYPLINIIIATSNSDKTLEKTLASIKKQNYPKSKTRVYIIDGGSTDTTKDIAKMHHCQILTNIKKEDIFAKHLGLLKANGKFILFLDSDELLENSQSLKIKYKAFKNDPRIKAVIPSGYKTPAKYASVNYYINEFGDPFSFFMYRESKGFNFSMEKWIYKYRKIYEGENEIVFDFSTAKDLPLIELCAGGCMLDLPYVKKITRKSINNPALIPHLFYLLNSKNTLFAVTKNDYTVHYSSPNFWVYLKKIKSRVKNNIYLTIRGKGGFVGRERFRSLTFRLKKYLFIPYSLSIIFPLYDSIYLTITRKKTVYLTHVFLCIYTTTLIIYYQSLKFLNIKVEIKNYGN